MRCVRKKLKQKTNQILFLQSAMSVNNGATLFFCVFMSIWVAYFLESWKRKQALLGHIWGVLKFDQSDVSWSLTCIACYSHSDDQIGEVVVKILFDKMTSIEVCSTWPYHSHVNILSFFPGASKTYLHTKLRQLEVQPPNSETRTLHD